MVTDDLTELDKVIVDLSVPAADTSFEDDISAEIVINARPTRPYFFPPQHVCVEIGRR